MDVFLDYLRDFWKDAKLILKQPAKFFEGLKKEEKIKPSIIYLLTLLVIGTILSIASTLLLQPILSQVISNMGGAAYQVQQYTPDLVVASFLSSVAFGVLFSFVLATIVHLWIKLFKGKGKWLRSYQLFVYSRTPEMLLGWIPIVNIVIWIYGIVLFIIGVQKLHSLSKKRAILIFVIPSILFVLISFVSFILLAGSATSTQ